MNKYFTDEVNAQIILAVLKQHGIRKIIASPGTTNIPITGSVQNDPFFETYSSVDERSAAYMACGMCHESGEPVVLSCTGATASRNYLPGMTEAFYRKLPIIAITSTASVVDVGHLLPQCIDRSKIPADVARISVTLPPVKDAEDFWDCEIKVNTAILEAFRNGGGPVHINLVTSYLKTFNTRTLPKVRAIRRYFSHDELPNLDPQKKIAVFIGAHKFFSPRQTQAIEAFVKTHNAVVLCDHTSSYQGYGKIVSALSTFQQLHKKAVFAELKPDLIIHLGEVSGDYPTLGFLSSCKAPVWRVSPDGALRDRFKTLETVFEMRAEDFFSRYAEQQTQTPEPQFLQAWVAYNGKIRSNLPTLPFSTTWIAQQLSEKIPNGANIHLGILNSLRNWDLFQPNSPVSSACNVGGFGIDGCVSSLIGAALTSPDKIHFGIVGDLAFFYDLSSIGNRHLPRNLRLIVVNNGGGCEFELSSHFGSQFGNKTGDFISAAGHFGNKSPTLIKSITESLGFKYAAAYTKEDFEKAIPLLLAAQTEQPVIFECFTHFATESKALELMGEIDSQPPIPVSNSKKIKAGVWLTIRAGIRSIFKMLPDKAKTLVKDSLE